MFRLRTRAASAIPGSSLSMTILSCRLIAPDRRTSLAYRREAEVWLGSAWIACDLSTSCPFGLMA